MKRLIVLFCVLLSVNGYRILGISPFPIHSHYTLVFRLMEELADRGHDVTFINCFPQKTPIKNFKNIVVEELREPIGQISSYMRSFADLSYLQQMEFVTEMGTTIFKSVFKNEEVRNLLKSDETFDAVILNYGFTESLSYFAYKFKCPLVLLAPWSTNVFNNYLTGNPAPSSFVTHLLSDYDANMNFWQRLDNVFRESLGELFIHLRLIPEQEKVLKQMFPDTPDLTTIIYNTSLLLSPSHVSFTHPIPIQQNVQEIGGYHVIPPKPLPKELQEFMDNSTEGVVYFSMGSHLRGSIFESDKLKIFSNAFSKIKQKVLWKFDKDLPRIPENVKISSWLPQCDILGHPNTVAFVSHGGLLSTTEAVYNGVPILGMPVHWDQVKNIAGAVQKGYAVRIDFKYLTEKSFEAGLNEILDNPKYRRSAEEHSRIMHDQPMKPLDKAMFWIEYVIRHKGAPHLRSAAVNLRWYQLYHFDIILFIVVCFSVILISLCVILRRFFITDEHIKNE